MTKAQKEAEAKAKAEEAKAQKEAEAKAKASKGVKVKHLLDGDFYIGAYLIEDVVPKEVTDNKELNARFERALKLGILEKA